VEKGKADLPFLLHIKSTNVPKEERKMKTNQRGWRLRRKIERDVGRAQSQSQARDQAHKGAFVKQEGNTLSSNLA
jgi:hypothetical protein